MPLLVFIFFLAFTTTSASFGCASVKAVKNNPPKSPKLYDVQLGEPYQKNDLVLIVENAQITAGALGIRYRFINNNVTKKIDLGQKFKFSLSDEYRNYYQGLKPPADYPHVVSVYPAHFPSLYPGEEYEETIFFEAPIAQSSFLFLTVDITPAKLSDAVTIRIPMDQVGREVSQEKIAEKPLDVPVKPQSIGDFLKIHSPQKDRTLYPGEAIQLDVELGKDLGVPESILIVSPIYTLRDLSYGLHYAVRVPPDYKKDSLTIIVIAKWPGEGTEKLLSDSLTFTILDLKEKCVHDCIVEHTPGTDAASKKSTNY